MRIIAGVARGHGVRAPRGTGTRPTTDRVREAIFDMLAARSGRVGADAEAGHRVLDLFAGSGALGLEALSRGATSATFVECHAPTLRVAQANARELGLGDRARFVREDAHRAMPALAAAGERFDRVFLDPPYAGEDLVRALDALGSDCPALLAEGALVVAEHSRRADPGDRHGALDRVVRRDHGDTSVSLYALRGRP